MLKLVEHGITLIIALAEIALVFLFVFACGYIHNRSVAQEIQRKNSKGKNKDYGEPGKYWW